MLRMPKCISAGMSKQESHELAEPSLANPHIKLTRHSCTSPEKWSSAAVQFAILRKDSQVQHYLSALAESVDLLGLGKDQWDLGADYKCGWRLGPTAVMHRSCCCMTWHFLLLLISQQGSRLGKPAGAHVDGFCPRHGQTSLLNYHSGEGSFALDPKSPAPNSASSPWWQKGKRTESSVGLRLLSL